MAALRLGVLATGVLLSAQLSASANYPLEVTNIRPDMDASNRLSRAYPGLEYNVRAAVIGGVFPYSYELENAPPGMTINRNTGTVIWPNPSADASPTLVVTDSEGTRRTAEWTIRVTTDGFRFVDGSSGKHAAGNGCSADCGTGTAANPWRSVSDMYRNGKAGEVVYFRTGTYSITDLPRSGVGTGWDRVEFAEASRPVIWLAEPGHSPIVDFAHKPGVEDGLLIRFTGFNVYVDGFETINSHLIGFQYAGGLRTGPTFRRLRMHGLGPGLEGSNAAFIMTMTDSRPSNYGVIQDCEFWGVSGAAVTIKIYAQQKLLIEDTVHHDTPVAIELKDDVRQFTVRGNRFYNVERTAIGGNMHQATTHGEILFNYARAGLALDLNQDGMAGVIHAYRNTLIGRVQIRNTDASDGPFFLSDNVIVNGDRGDSRVHFESVAARDRVVLSNNLSGGPRDNLVDDNGELAGKFAKHQGTHGHKH